MMTKQRKQQIKEMLDKLSPRPWSIKDGVIIDKNGQAIMRKAGGFIFASDARFVLLAADIIDEMMGDL